MADLQKIDICSVDFFDDAPDYDTIAIVTPILSIHSVCNNEHDLLALFVAFYRARFPNVPIFIHNNDSTDDSVEIAHTLQCTVTHFSANGKFDENLLTMTRNNCWKNDGTNSTFVMVVDIDEFCDIDMDTLRNFERSEANVFCSSGIDMVGMSDDDISPKTITMGYARGLYSKPILFKRNEILDINFGLGSHFAYPIASELNKVKMLNNGFIMYHFHKINIAQTIRRRNIRASRNKGGSGGAGLEGLNVHTESITHEFEIARSIAMHQPGSVDLWK